MASIQYEKKEEVGVQFSSEEKASLDEILKHAEDSYESEGIENQALDIVAKHDGLCGNDGQGKLVGGGQFGNDGQGKLVGGGQFGNDGQGKLVGGGRFGNDGQGKVGVANLAMRIVVVAGALKNQTKGSLKILDNKKWAGHVVKNFPNPLSGTGAFSLSAMSAKGVKAGVAYAGKNRAGVECAWLLAFADTTATKRRIYAECGPKSKFNKIDWAKIEEKLVNAGQLAKASDKATGTSVYATIAGSNGKDMVAAAFAG